jgi:hypothetical protein
VILRLISIPYEANNERAFASRRISHVQFPISNCTLIDNWKSEIGNPQEAP